ncbi:MAG: HAMP domain-containing sensor histidine kinase [Pseudomonadota bacterium]
MAVFSKSKRQNRPIFDTWVGFVPLAIVMLSIIITLAWTRWQLARSATAFQNEFLQQNLTELASGDTMTLSRRLEALSNSIHWSCIEGRRQNHTFFVRHRGACGSGFFHQEVDLAAPGNQDIELKATLSLPSDLLGIAVILMVGQLGLFPLLWRSTQVHERIRLNSLLEKERAESAVNRAVAGMTSMLAHDIRGPFSILRTGIAMLNNAKDLNGVKKILGLLVPEIDKAVSSVDGLISDVMEVGSTATELIQEPVSAESLIEAALGDIFRVYPKADVTIAYDLKHSHMVNVHALKIARVFSNILGNAIQAMNYKGSLWFKTREQDGCVEFCLGNAGSIIPPESLTKLFDSFFTSGKKGGTGLGLAIAEKVVKAHGGRIWCESSKTTLHPEGKVEFFFTLPIVAGYSSKTTATLPKHSSEIIQALAPFTAPEVEILGNIDRAEITLETDIV